MRRPIALLLLHSLVAGCTSAATGTPTSTPGASASASSSASVATSALVDIGAGLDGPPGLAATIYATGLANVSAFAFDPEG
jgi:hypothetical protein